MKPKLDYFTRLIKIIERILDGKSPEDESEEYPRD